MATSIPTGPVDPTTYHGDGPSTGQGVFGNDAQQPGYYSWSDDEGNQGPTGEAVGGEGDDDTFFGGAQHHQNAAEPGSTSAPGQPSGSGGGAGSTGIVGEVING